MDYDIGGCMCGGAKQKKKVYCGAKDTLPRGYKSFGTPKDCIKSKQIRRFGLNKVDTRMLERAMQEEKNIKKLEKERKDLLTKIMRIRGTIKMKQSNLVTFKNPEEKKVQMEQIEQLKKQSILLNKEYNIIDAKIKGTDKK